MATTRLGSPGCGRGRDGTTGCDGPDRVEGARRETTGVSQPGFQEPCCQADAMASPQVPGTAAEVTPLRRGAGGRPSHHYAKAFKVRLDGVTATAVLAMSTELDQPYQPVLEALVDIGLGHCSELPSPVEPASLDGMPSLRAAAAPAHRPSADSSRPFKLRLKKEPTTAVLDGAGTGGYQPYLAALIELGLRYRDELPASLQAATLFTTQEVLLDKTG